MKAMQSMGSKRKKYTPLKPISARKIRKSIQRSQLRFRKDSLEVKRPVSQRGRTHWMEEEAPGMTKTRIPQTLLMGSTVIKRFKYYISKKLLKIWFQSGHIYIYFDVPESIVTTLSQAQSKGRYFYYNIRTSFKFERIR